MSSSVPRNVLSIGISFLSLLLLSLLLLSFVGAFTILTLSRRREKNYPFTNLSLFHRKNEISVKTKEKFQDKHVLLTGASGGLGKAIALQLIHECHVQTLILTGRKEESLQEVAGACYNNDSNVFCLACDLSDLDAVEGLGQKALQLCRDRGGSGVVDVLINNGGLSSRSNFIDTDISVDDYVMRVNFLAGALLAKQVVPAMQQQGGGTILWIGGVQGLVGIPERTSNVASKFAIQGYCQALRAELASSGITVHVASPGYIRTNLSRNAIQGDGTIYGEMDDTTANGAEPNHVATTILNSVADGKSDFVVAAGFSAKVAIWLRFLTPKILEQILVQRIQTSQTKTQ